MKLIKVHILYLYKYYILRLYLLKIPLSTFNIKYQHLLFIFNYIISFQLNDFY